MRVLYFDSLPSTNTEALSQAKRGASEGLCVVAREQTAGKGRNGREWVSNKDSGLYLSALLRPDIPQEKIPLVTLAAAVAVHETLRELYDIRADIKWPNDLLKDNKKICGILCEAVKTQDGMAVVIGIGINLLRADISDAIGDTATSVEQETGRKSDREELISSLVRGLFRYCDKLSNNVGRLEVLEDWSERSTWSKGKAVRAELDTGPFEGTTQGIDLETGGLIVSTPTGEVIVKAGDVTSIRQTAYGN